VRWVYRKAHLWDAESRWFTLAVPPGDTDPVGRIAVMICYDLSSGRLAARLTAPSCCAPRQLATRGPTASGLLRRGSSRRAVNLLLIAAAPHRRGAWRRTGATGHADADGWPLAEATMTAGPITITP
jgi:predicted amidohydrolase